MYTTRTLTLVALGAILPLRGCASTQVKSDWNRQTNFGKDVRNPKFIGAAVDKALAKYPALAGA